MFKNLIFDWSGTLIDDLSLTLDASNYVFRQYGKTPLNTDEFRAEFQLPYPIYYSRVLPDADLEELENHFRHAFRQSEEKVTVLPHAKEFLEFCRASSIRCFILTSVDATEFEKQCKELGLFDYFEAIHSGIRHKTDHIHTLLARHGLHPDETAFIGDMQHDIETAKHGNITSIAVLTGYNLASQLAAAQPDIIIPHLQTLQQLLARKQSTLSAEQDSIHLKGLDITCHIGVPEEERVRPQNLKADISLHLPLRNIRDDITHTIDYDALATRLIAEASSKHRLLIETLANDLADVCLHAGAFKATVTIRKYILPHTEYVAATVSR